MKQFENQFKMNKCTLSKEIHANSPMSLDKSLELLVLYTFITTQNILILPCKDHATLRHSFSCKI